MIVEVIVVENKKGSFAIPIGLFFLGMVCLKVAKFIWDVM